jgi:lipopolysaccharide transport protein LptA
VQSNNAPKKKLQIIFCFCAKILPFFLLLLFLVINITQAKAALVSNLAKTDTPTRIRSDIIDIKRKSQVIDFIGNVVVEKDNSSMLAQKMTIFYKENSVSDNEKKAATAIKRIDATENVKIFTEEYVASGESGYYDPGANIFVLQKNVIVNNGTSIASGEKFVYNLVTKKGKFVGKTNETSIAGNGGDKRVVVVIGEDSQSLKQNKSTAKKPKKIKKQKNNE